MPEAEKAGIVFIHQELNVLFDLTVEENMFLGKEIKKKCGVCDKKAMRREVKKILKRLGVEIDPGQRMEELSVGQQQMVEIAKALMADAKVIIMDEPTAALTQKLRPGYCLKWPMGFGKKAYPLFIFRTGWKRFLNCATGLRS